MEPEQSTRKTSTPKIRRSCRCNRLYRCFSLVIGRIFASADQQLSCRSLPCRL
ncbi:hypothetical protein Hanom_Chr01g00016391 [Helianthus anomalus]